MYRDSVASLDRARYSEWASWMAASKQMRRHPKGVLDSEARGATDAQLGSQSFLSEGERMIGA
jgi:hypothetical protein